jgi:hypothetical protein
MPCLCLYGFIRPADSSLVVGGHLTGELLTNGKPRNHENFTAISAYVTQDDSLYAFLVGTQTYISRCGHQMSVCLPAAITRLAPFGA